MTVWLLVTPEPLFDFFCIHLWNNSKADMVHLVWEGVSTDCMRHNLEILSPFMYSTSGSSNHLLFMWPTYSWLWLCGWPTYRCQHRKWLVCCMCWVPSFSHLNLKSWYLFQVGKINARHDTVKCQSYITILSTLCSDQTQISQPISKGATHAWMFTFTVSPGSCMNRKLVWPRNYWSNCSLKLGDSKGCNF